MKNLALIQRLFKSAAVILGLCLLVACSDSGDSGSNTPVDPVDPVDPNIITIETGENFETDLKTALIEAQPGHIIILPEGKFDMTGGLILDVSNVTIRGQGESTTVLNFAAQTSGGDGLLVTSNNVVLEDFAVEDTPGDGIKFKFSNGVTIRRMRVEWTCGPCSENGGYAIYPVSSENILIEDSIAIGASDSGIYVGQSNKVIVRRNHVSFNVAGIEIENSINSDVYENTAINNTGGILAFDLPGLPQAGSRVRFFNNTVRDNNTPNFAHGGVLAVVPQGTGMIVMAFEDVEIFGNIIENHRSLAIGVVNYAITDLEYDDPKYDPAPMRVNIYDNQYSNNGYDPEGLAAQIAPIFGAIGGLPADFYDGIAEAGAPFEEVDKICIREEASVTLGILIGPEGSASTDSALFDCAHASLPAVTLDSPEDIEEGETPPTEEEIAALCTPDETSSSANFDAVEVSCPTLSGYNLFADQSEPRELANGGIHYDLTTPLFTDYAAQYRFMFVPEGQQAAYSTREVLDFPIGTIISKTFSMPRDFLNEAAGEVIIETRILIHRTDGWEALPYIWREDGSDADLTITGGTREVSWIHTDGSSRSTDYVIPDTNSCKTCHNTSQPETGSGTRMETVLDLIGPKARFLNQENEYGGEMINQLSYMEEQGVLIGLPEDLESIATVPDWEDTAAALQERAKGYLDINCAHCHRPSGFASNSALFLDFWREVDVSYGICKTPIAAGNGSGGFKYDIVPGDASTSITTHRMDSNDTDVRMPEIGRSIIHDEGVALIEEWINSMSGGCQ
jgi:parallel beta-helix repeat protein